MRTIRIYALLAVMIAVGIASLKAQQPYDLEEVFVTDEATPVYAQYINTEEMIVFTTNTEKFQFIKMRENGEILGTVDYPFAPESETYLVSRFM